MLSSRDPFFKLAVVQIARFVEAGFGNGDQDATCHFNVFILDGAVGSCMDELVPELCQVCNMANCGYAPPRKLQALLEESRAVSGAQAVDLPDLAVHFIRLEALKTATKEVSEWNGPIRLCVCEELGLCHEHAAMNILEKRFE